MDSLEYKVLHKLSPYLILCIEQSPDDIFVNLRPSGILAPGDVSFLQNPTNSKLDKAQRIASVVLTQVQLNTLVFEQFIEAMRASGSWTEATVHKIEEEYKSFAVTTSPPQEDSEDSDSDEYHSCDDDDPQQPKHLISKRMTPSFTQETKTLQNQFSDPNSVQTQQSSTADDKSQLDQLSTLSSGAKSSVSSCSVADSLLDCGCCSVLDYILGKNCSNLKQCHPRFEISKLPQKEIDFIKEEWSQQTVGIRMKFSMLVVDTIQELRETFSDFDDLISLLKSLLKAKLTSELASQIENDLDELKPAEVPNHLLDKCYCTWFDYDLIELLREKLYPAEDKALVNYKKLLKGYVSRRCFFNFNITGPWPEGHVKVTCKFDKEYCKLSEELVKRVKHIIVKTMEVVSLFHLSFMEAQEGCIKLIFVAPPYFSEISLSEYQKAQLKKYGFIKITVGEKELIQSEDSDNEEEVCFEDNLEHLCIKDLMFKEQIELDVSPCSLWKVLHDGQPHMALVYNGKVANKAQFCEFIDDIQKEKQNVLKVCCTHLIENRSEYPILLFNYKLSEVEQQSENPILPCTDYYWFQDYCLSYKLSEVEQLTVLRDVALVALDYFQQQPITKLDITLQSIILHKEGDLVTQALFLPLYQHSVFPQVKQPAESPAGYAWIKDALMLMVYQNQNIENNELPEGHILFNIFKYKWFSKEKMLVSNNIFDVTKEISYILDLERTQVEFANAFHSSDLLEISHIHVILIGHTGVGKTSLRKHLQNIPFNEAERSTVVMEQELLHQETVETSTNSSSLLFHKSEDVYKSEPGKCYLTLWDSGGQPMFQDLLPCFARLRSIFGIVFRLCDLSKNSSPTIRPICSELEIEQESPYTCIDFVHRCLAFIQLFAPLQSSVPSELKAALFESQGIEAFPKVALIGTFKDKVRVDNPQLSENFVFKDTRESSRTLLPESAKSGIFEIDNTLSGKKYEDSGMNELKKQLVAYSRSTKAKIPSSWVSFKIELERETRIQQPCTGIVSLEKAVKKAKECGLDPVQPLHYFNELGIFLWYYNNDSLKDYVITDPKHLVNILGTILNPEKFAKTPEQWKQLKVRGVIDSKLAKKLLDSSETGLPVEWIFSFFEEHHLGIFVSEGYFIPSMLQIGSHGCQNHLHNYDVVNSVCTVLSSTEVAPLFIVPQSECIPPGFFPRLITVLAGIQDGNVVWELSTNNEIYKNKVSFDVNNHICITFTEFIGCVRICLSNFSNSTNFQKLCRSVLSQLKVQLQRIFPQASRIPVSVTFMCSKTPHFLPSPPSFIQDSACCDICDSNFELTEAHKVWLRPPPPKIATDKDAQELLQLVLKQGVINLQVSTMLYVGENSSFTHILFGEQTKSSLYNSKFYIAFGETVSALTHEYLSEFFACNAMLPQKPARVKVEKDAPIEAQDIATSKQDRSSEHELDSPSEHELDSPSEYELDRPSEHELDSPSEHELDHPSEQSSIIDTLNKLLENSSSVTQTYQTDDVPTKSPKTTLKDSFAIGRYRKHKFKFSPDNILQLMFRAHKEKYSIELFEGIECSNMSILKILPLLIQRTATFGVGNDDTFKFLQEMNHLPTKWVIAKEVSSADEFPRTVDITVHQKILPKHLALLSHKSEEREIPFAWFYLYHLIKNGFSEIKRKVMSMEEVSGIADMCHISVDQLPKVLSFLHELGFLLYYKDILPDVIFEDASVIIKVLTNAYLNNESIIDTSLLNQVHNVYYYNLFTLQDATKLLQSLSIISKISDHTYCIPTLLKEKFVQKLTKNVQPLHIQCPIAPCVFEYLICYLTSEQVENIWPLKIQTHLSKIPTCLYKNCAELILLGYDCTITLLASLESIKVYVDFLHEEPPLSKLTKSIISGLKKANSSYFCPETEIKFGFDCTCGLFNAEHTMVYHKKEQLLKCSRDTGKSFPISMSQKSWFGEGTAEDDDALSVHNVFKYLLPRCKGWFQIGLELSLTTRLLQDISTRCRDKHDIALMEVVKQWFKHSPNPTWKLLNREGTRARKPIHHAHGPTKYCIFTARGTLMSRQLNIHTAYLLLG